MPHPRRPSFCPGTPTSTRATSIAPGNNVIDVHDAIVTGGNLVISAGNGTNVIAVAETHVNTAVSSTAAGNVTITAGNGGNLIIMVSLEVSGGLTVSTGTGSST